MPDDVARHLAHGVLAGPDRKASSWTAHPDPVNLRASGPSGRRDSLAHKFGDVVTQVPVIWSRAMAKAGSGRRVRSRPIETFGGRAGLAGMEVSRVIALTGPGGLAP
jgi:hypothetical protein